MAPSGHAVIPGACREFGAGQAISHDEYEHNSYVTRNTLLYSVKQDRKDVCRIKALPLHLLKRERRMLSVCIF